MLSLLVVALLFFSRISQGGWVSVDQFSSGEFPVHTAKGIAKDPDGRLFVVGVGSTAVGSSAVYVRSSMDDGMTWATVDSFASGQSSQMDLGGRPAFNQQGDVFLGVDVYQSNTQCHWLVRKGSKHGTVWSTVDDYEDSRGCARPYGSAVDSQGRVFVVGVVFGDRARNVANFHWLVRSSVDNGISWSTVDDFFVPDGVERAPEPSGIAIDGSDSIYVAGTFGTDFGFDGLVRRSSDHGQTWKNVFSPVRSESVFWSWFQSIDVSATGDIFVGGFAHQQVGWFPLHWIVYKSVDHGTSWTLVDDYTGLASGGVVNSVRVGAGGRVVAAGYGVDSRSDSKTNSQGLVRVSRDGGATWTNGDQVGTDVTGFHSEFFGTEFKADGNLISCGAQDTQENQSGFQTSGNWGVWSEQ